MRGSWDALVTYNPRKLGPFRNGLRATSVSVLGPCGLWSWSLEAGAAGHRHTNAEPSLGCN